MRAYGMNELGTNENHFPLLEDRLIAVYRNDHAAADNIDNFHFVMPVKRKASQPFGNFSCIDRIGKGQSSVLFFFVQFSHDNPPLR